MKFLSVLFFVTCFSTFFSKDLKSSEPKINPDIGALLQVWGVYNNPGANAQSANGGNTYRSGAIIRRAELSVSEEREDGVSWKLMLDGSKGIFDSTGANAASDAKILQDLFITYKFSDLLNITVGQFIIPTTLEGPHPSGDLVFSERSYLGRGFGDSRDVGIKLNGELNGFHYQLSSLNGEGNNQGPGESMRQLIANIGYKNSLFHIGAWNNHKKGEGSGPDDNIYGVYGNISYKKLLFQTEFIDQTKLKKSGGFYVMAKYQFTDKNSIAARYDFMKDNPLGNRQTAYDLGYERIHGKNFKSKLDLRIGEEESTGIERDIEEVIYQLQLTI